MTENEKPRVDPKQFLAEVREAIAAIPTEGQPALNDVFGETLGEGITQFVEGMGNSRTTRRKAQVAQEFGDILNRTEEPAKAWGALAYALDARQKQGARERAQAEFMG